MAFERQRLGRGTPPPDSTQVLGASDVINSLQEGPEWLSLIHLRKGGELL